MKYIDQKDYIEYINSDKKAKDFIDAIQIEVNEFFDSFKDDPSKMSSWAHHYFCKHDGGLLIFDTAEPNKHVCSICGESYVDDELLNGVWHTMNRNLAATNAWKSAALYRYTGKQKYLDNVVTLVEFYADNYHKFKLHNKEGLEFDSIENAKWGASRIMPQSLNEAILLIRLTNALEMVKNKLSQDFMDKIEKKLFAVAFNDMKPQINEVHNIRCWLNSAIGVMGLFTGNKEMTDFAFSNEYNIIRQLEDGVTADYFWYEGSIHYNFFLLEGVVNLMLFCRLYDYDFSFGEDIVEKMLVNAYNYAFDNDNFPNPNDGWPNINLKTYSYIYAMASKVYGKDSEVSALLSSIINKDTERATIPLSRPYYYKNEISLEEFLFAAGIKERNTKADRVDSYNFATSYASLIKSDDINIFVKYGHNGPSHAHPDKMNIEVMLKDKVLSRDLSNSGYGNPFCNEWHRVSASHNTVIADGRSHSNINDGGVCNSFSKNAIDVECSNVYEGIDYRRKIEIAGSKFYDEFTAISKEEHTYDYIFHVEGKLINDVQRENGELEYDSDGYQHIKDVQKVISSDETVALEFDVDGIKAVCKINVAGKQLYLAESPDNPVNNVRTSIIVRDRSRKAIFKINWEMED